MSDERRYQPDEIEAIFEAAASEHAPGHALARADGLTLAELQSIGSEVGLAPDRIAAAAAALDRQPAALARRTSLGLPVAVGRTIDLPRAPTDHEWATLLGDVRQTFAAQGRELSHGETRGWANGNLHVFIEPTESGWRLRMGTLKSEASPTTITGIGALLFALVLFVVLSLNGELADKLIAPLIFALGGTAALARNIIALPRWADEREQQMEHLAERALTLLSAGPRPGS